MGQYSTIGQSERPDLRGKSHRRLNQQNFFSCAHRRGYRLLFHHPKRRVGVKAYSQECTVEAFDTMSFKTLSALRRIASTRPQCLPATAQLQATTRCPGMSKQSSDSITACSCVLYLNLRNESYIRFAPVVNVTLVIHSCCSSPFPTLSPVECQAHARDNSPEKYSSHVDGSGNCPRLECNLAGMLSMMCFLLLTICFAYESMSILFSAVYMSLIQHIDHYYSLLRLGKTNVHMKY